MLNLEFAHGRSGFQRTVENLPKGRHGSDGFFEIFAVEFCHKMQKENPPKKSTENPPAETKNPPAHNPPEIHQPGPKMHRKTYQ